MIWRPGNYRSNGSHASFHAPFLVHSTVRLCDVCSLRQHHWATLIHYAQLLPVTCLVKVIHAKRGRYRTSLRIMLTETLDFHQWNTSATYAARAHYWQNFKDFLHRYGNARRSCVDITQGKNRPALQTMRPYSVKVLNWSASNGL